MITYEDLRHLMREGILTPDAHYDSLHERIVITWTWQLPAYVQDIFEAHGVDLYREMREADGARLPVVE
jgi:hypothetical protein